MSIRQEMLQAARRAPALLRERRGRVEGFVRSRLNGDGGFRGRGRKSDLYYTVFGIECLAALGAELPARELARYLQDFDDGQGLDLVHLACLARCRSVLAEARPSGDMGGEILARIESFRHPDGGYGGSTRGSAYGCFLAVGAYQDLKAEISDEAGLVRCLESLRTGDGGYGNQPGSAVGLTTAAAAAATVLRHLGRPVQPAARDWLMRQWHASGGFVAAPGLPQPDLLSTATALHALAGMQTPLSGIADPCIRFIEGLASGDGGFRGHHLDGTGDCEYTYYALLALGHLVS